jgi:hypothetical protein
MNTHKIIISTILILFNTLTLSGEVTGAGSPVHNILRSNNINIGQLDQQGYQLLIGEVTGAGKNVYLDRVKYLISSQEIYDMDRLNNIEYNIPSEAKKLLDVKKFVFDNSMLPTTKIKAMIIEK